MVRDRSCVVFVTVNDYVEEFYANGIAPAVNAAMIEKTAEPNVRLVDWNAVIAASPESLFQWDGVHPNAAGATALAGAVRESVETCP